MEILWILLAANLIGILILLGRSFLSAYATEKGKNVATKKDIAAITNEIERVKSLYANELKQLEHRHDRLLEEPENVNVGFLTSGDVRRFRCVLRVHRPPSIHGGAPSAQFELDQNQPVSVGFGYWLPIFAGLLMGRIDLAEPCLPSDQDRSHVRKTF